MSKCPASKPSPCPCCLTLPDGPDAMEQALGRYVRTAKQAIAEGYNILILSDRGIDPQIGCHPRPAGCFRPASLSHPRGIAHAGGDDHRIGRAREVHHFALLVGYGATAINPYLAYETLDDMIKQGLLPASISTRRTSNTSRPVSKAWSRPCRRWAFPPCRATAALRF